jgi:YjbE family integral membrane protein
MAFDWVSSILQIVLVNAVLSGDNAMVIALAAHRLPAAQRRQAMILGTGLAIVLRLVLTLVVSVLLLVPGLRFVGAVVLAYIACKLLQEEEQPVDSGREGPTSMRTAIVRIALADLIMSLDNVIAIAGVSQSDPVRLAVGLVLSITMILALSTAIVAIMNRYRWIVYAGTAVLALTAASMMIQDVEVYYGSRLGEGTEATYPRWAAWTIRISVLVLCMTANRWLPGGSAKPAQGPVDESARPLERVLD